MGIKDQLVKLKDNWILVLLILIIVIFLSGGNLFGSGNIGMLKSAEIGAAYDESFSAERSYLPAPSEDFAPEAEERIITKTASLSTEVERGTFEQEASKLKTILKSSDSYLLNENVNRYGTDRRSYMRGYYSIKVDTAKYDSVIAQLKEIGKVQSFNENTDDITGRYTNLEVEIEAEKERLKRYEEMYKEAAKVEDKINLNDRIFNQERTIKYLEQSLENLDKKVDYSTISFSMTEKQSEYINVVFVKFSQLIRALVGSFNAMLTLLFVLLPWALGALVIWLIVRLFRRR